MRYSLSGPLSEPSQHESPTGISWLQPACFFIKIETIKPNELIMHPSHKHHTMAEVIFYTIMIVAFMIVMRFAKRNASK
jgi:hypothetical protein